jgi:hypothetical protein
MQPAALHYGFIFVAVGGMVRRHFQFNLVDVMVYEIPNPDYLLRLCKGLRMLRWGSAR